MSVELADLHCETCDQVTEHELHYSGRLLESTRCTVCGAHLDVPARDMLPAYLADLEQRVVSKPRRMVRRVGPRTRSASLRQLPRAIARQPAKFLARATVDLPALTRRVPPRYAPGDRPRRRTPAGAPPRWCSTRRPSERRLHQLHVAARPQPGDHRGEVVDGRRLVGGAAARRCRRDDERRGHGRPVPRGRSCPGSGPSTTVLRVSVTGRTATNDGLRALVGAPVATEARKPRRDQGAEHVVGEQAASGRRAAPCPTSRRGRAPSPAAASARRPRGPDAGRAASTPTRTGPAASASARRAWA